MTKLSGFPEFLPGDRLVELHVIDEGFDEEESAPVLGMSPREGRLPGRVTDAVAKDSGPGVGHLDPAAVALDPGGDAVAGGRAGMLDGVRAGLGQGHRKVEGDVGVHPGGLHRADQKPSGQWDARSLAPQME